MRVLQVNINYKTGSTGKIMYDIHNKLITEGFESFVAFGRGRSKAIEKNEIKIGSNLDVYFHVLGTRVFDKHGLYSKKATYKFIEKIDKLNIDIFHLHNIHGYYINYSVLFDYLKNKKVIWTLHDCWAFTGHCSHYDYIGCSKWESGCYSCPQKNRYPRSWLLDNSRENFRLKKHYFTLPKDMIIVTPSRWLANEVKKSFLQKYEVITIHNGVDLNVFKPIKNNFRKKYSLENAFLILGVANVWEERKGFQYFIKLSKMVRKDEKIILVGLNSKQLQLLPKNIIGMRRTDNLEELVEIYSSVDVFVNPTLEDNFPTTNIESLACGTPVITFNTGGSPECIDEYTGIIVEKSNLKELHKAVRTIKHKGKSYYSDKCRQRAVELFDKNKNYSEYIELYKRFK